MTQLTTRQISRPPISRATGPTRSSGPTKKVPALIRLSNPIARSLLGRGMPMGPNVLLRVRGRVTGEPRTAPVAVVEIDGRRFVMGAYGDVHWVRNLRAAGEADLQVHGTFQHMIAVELEGAAATAFYREELPAYIARFPWVGRLFGRILLGVVSPEMASDPELAALRHPVFELRPA